MLNVPYVGNPGSVCALACHTMVAKYFFPETTWDDIAAVVDWEPGKVIWAFRFWLWLMNRGIRVEDYDLIDYEAWATSGVEGLKQSVSEKEFDFYLSRSKNLDSYTPDIARLLVAPEFIYHRCKPEWTDLVRMYQAGALCEVVLDSKSLDQQPGFSLHRVVVLEVTEDSVVFHDPRKEPRPARREPRTIFEHAWLGAVREPELCAYQKI